MKNIEELRSAVAALRDEITELAALDDITPEQDARLDEAIAEHDTRNAELVKAEARAAEVARIAEAREAGVVTEERGYSVAPQVIRKVNADLDLRSAAPGEVRDAARKLIDEATFMSSDDQARAEKALSRRSGKYDGDKVARAIVATERPEYRSAFMKLVGGAEYLLDDSERRAVAEARAMSLTDTSGGFGVPVLIDPTVLITDGTGLLDILPYCRIESITNDAWKGVSAAHTAWSFDAEAAEVSDDSSTFAQPTVPTAKAQAFIPYSIEIGMDYPSFASEMGRLLSDGYVDLLAQNMAVGTGTDAPTGVYTALDANTNVEVAVTTNGQFGAADIDKVWAALPEKFRARSTWYFSVSTENAIRAFSAGDNYNRFTVDQSAGGLMRLNGRPVVLSDYCPALTTATTGAKILVVGDFSNYLVAQRVGMTVEVVPHLFATGNNRPNGTRGLYAYARVGADSVVDNAFRVLGTST